MFRSHIFAVLVSSGIASIGFTLTPLPCAADGWSEVGSPSRPSWVHASVERRLRLLSALPSIESTLKTQANGYFGANGPGMSVGLILDDGLFYSQGFGFRDAARKLKPDEYTVFRAGSLSKVITGTALLTLIDDPAKKMSLEDAADEPRYLPELKFVCPSFDSPCQRGSQNLGIKLKHLVSHTAGLANVMEQTNASVPVWLGDLKKSWLLFQPGAYAAYSGVGVEGVGLIGERISGESYVNFVKHNLFAPLGMTQSSMDQTTLPKQSQAQKWLFSAKKGSPHSTWSFTKFDSIIAGDDQPMIAPAGGLATSVRDLSLFIKMWLAKVAPHVNGRALLTPSTMQAAVTSQFASTAAPPDSCNYANNHNGRKDSNGFGYSVCGTAFGFGVNWYVGTAPYIQHNGDEPGLSGSNTVVDQAAKMGATGLISTEPFPAFDPQPPGLDSGFMNTVVMGLLTTGLAADGATSWTGQQLAVGVARLLYLSGKRPESGDLNSLTSNFIAAHKLSSTNIVSFLKGWHDRVGSCSTFRVREVDTASKITLRLYCAKSVWDVALDVEGSAPYKISWSELSSKQPDSPTAHEKCLEACNVGEGSCMSQTHSSAERQQCVHEKTSCDSGCK